MNSARAKLFLAASIALNIALLLALFARQQRAASKSFERPLRTAAATQRSNWPSPAPIGTVAPRTLWEALDHRDPRELMTRLRSVGCPEQTIREIIIFRLSREYHKALLAFQDGHFANWNYWEQQDPNYAIERSRLHRQLREERNAALAELLGEDPQKVLMEVGGWPEQEDQRGFLPENKRKALAALEQRHQSLQEELRFGQGVYFKTADGDPGARRELERLKRIKRAEIEQLLSPYELLELDLRESPAADYVRKNSPEAKSEEEFRQMVKAVLETGLVQKSPHEELMDRWAPADREELEARNLKEQEREQVLEERIKGVVGAERIDERDRQTLEMGWEEGREHVRSELITLAEGLNIDPEAMDALVERLKPVLLDRRMNMRGHISAEQRSQVEQVAKDQIDKTVLETLGEAGPEFIQRWNSKMKSNKKR